jgi:hypothetical protein
MLTYKAMYKYVDGGVHADVLDFPGAISSGRDLNEAREMLASALVDMAETICYCMNRCQPRTRVCPIPNLIWRSRSTLSSRLLPMFR